MIDGLMDLNDLWCIYIFYIPPWQKTFIVNNVTLQLSMMLLIIPQLGKFSEFGSATSDDFWSALETARKEADIKDSDFAIKTVMDTWINQTGYPLVKVTRNYETGETVISQTPYRKTDTDEANKVHKTWWIPVTYTTQTKLDFSNTSIYWLTDSNTLNFELDANDWVIVNLQQMGECIYIYIYIYIYILNV